MKNSLQQNVSERREKLTAKKDIIISIILTESTASLLKLDLPHLEDLDAEESHPSLCVIEAESKIEKTNYLKPCLQTKLSDFTKYWFTDKTANVKKSECERVASSIAYFRSNHQLRDSLHSIVSLDQFESDQTNGDSTTDLKPVQVYIRPLFSIRSLAHQNLIKSKKNTIYINVLNSKARMTESGWINVCRICHGGESFGDLLAPCQCRGSIALAHMECLERWLKESTNSKCELCQHKFKIIRQPKYSIPKSIFIFLRHPGEHLSELLYDLFAFMVYTPAAIASTYMLMLLCESVVKTDNDETISAQARMTALAAVFGMAAIDFTYSSWFMVNMQKHIIAWRSWYLSNCDVKVLLPAKKLRHRQLQSSSSIDDEVD